MCERCNCNVTLTEQDFIGQAFCETSMSCIYSHLCMYTPVIYASQRKNHLSNLHCDSDDRKYMATSVPIHSNAFTHASSMSDQLYHMIQSAPSKKQLTRTMFTFSLQSVFLRWQYHESSDEYRSRRMLLTIVNGFDCDQSAVDWRHKFTKVDKCMLTLIGCKLVQPQHIPSTG